MTHETFRELLPLYVIGALDAEELREFERYIAANRARCEPEIAASQAVADQIALAAPPHQPSPAVYVRILAAIEEKPAPVHPTIAPEPLRFDVRALILRWIPWAATAALCVLVLVMTDQMRTVTGQLEMAVFRQNQAVSEKMDLQKEVSGLNEQIRQFQSQVEQLSARNDAQQRSIETLHAANDRLTTEKAELQQATDQLRRQLDQQTVQVASLEKKIAEQSASLEFLMDPAIRVAQMKHPKLETKALAKVYWHDDKKTGLVVASNLEPVLQGGDKCLELWVICGNEAPVPAGIGWTDAAGHGVLQIRPGKELACADKFAVTIEPAGGLPVPTGPMILLGP
jgi:anti-sigma-K factor RskA